MKWKINIQLKVSLLVVISIAMAFSVSHADTKTDLENKIDQRNKDIQSLQIEIQNYQKQLNEISSEANSLTATIRELDLTKKKLEADIMLTQNQIEGKNLEIQQLGSQIENKSEAIDNDHLVISSSLSQIYEMDNRSLTSLVLGGHSLSGILDSMHEIGTIQAKVVSRINDLRQSKATLESTKQSTEKVRADLVVLNKQLGDQRKVVLNTQSEKNQLLSETKQSESQYKRLLAQKQAQKEIFEKEISQYEAQIKTIIDADELPHTGSGVLSWPVDQVKVTQYFGYTDFATANPQVYKGIGHNGIDLRASIGTPIKAALSGTVVGTGNTDLKSGCYSYGKWVMIRHENGLSTLYAHLSLPTVNKGQQVTTGQIIGYSGNTGYTTGPHLHFGVYATQGVQIKSVVSTTKCNGSIIPIAGYNAYLNPLSYL